MKNTFIHIRSMKFPILPGEEEELINPGMYGKALGCYFQSELQKRGHDIPVIGVPRCHCIWAIAPYLEFQGGGFIFNYRIAEANYGFVAAVVRTDRDYRVELRVLDRASHQVLAVYEKKFRSTLDQAILPDKPPVIGPGYHPNPARIDSGSSGEPQ